MPDGVLDDDTGLLIIECAVDRHGAALANLALIDLVGKRLSLRIWDLGKIILLWTGSRPSPRGHPHHAGPLLTRRANTELIIATWDDPRRVAASTKGGHATAVAPDSPRQSTQHPGGTVRPYEESHRPFMSGVVLYLISTTRVHPLDRRIRADHGYSHTSRTATAPWRNLFCVDHLFSLSHLV